MKVLVLGLAVVFALFVSMRVYRMVPRGTAKTQAGESSVPTATPQIVPKPVPGSGKDLAAGTVVSVTLADPIDSDHDPLGKQYAATVNVVDGQAIAPGSRATVVLLNNNSGWLTQLAGLTVNGRKFQVFSGAGSLIATGQDTPASPSPGILERVGLAPAAAPTSNQPVVLPPATQLRFVLTGTTTPARAVAVNPRHRAAAARIGAEPGPSPAQSIAQSRQPEIAYLCRASDVPDRPLPISYYIADVFKTSDSQAFVERRWHEFLVATYPYRFANNPHATAQCSRLTDPAADLSARQRLEGELKSENAGIVETRWHYTLGPTPPRASLPSASTLPPQ